MGFITTAIWEKQPGMILHGRSLTLMNSNTLLNENNDFKTLATSPEYSVLSKKKVQETFDIPILPWKESLKRLFKS